MAMYTRKDMVGLRFCPDDKDLISYLRWKVNGGGDSFIKDVDVYGSKPWLLPHVTEPVFQDNEWYYFVKKTIKVRKEETGSTWKSTIGEEEIRDGENAVVIGHAQNFAYMETETASKEQRKTDWQMRECRLPSEESQEWVICRIGYKSDGDMNEEGAEGRRTSQGNLGDVPLQTNSSTDQNVEDAAFQPFSDIDDDEFAWTQGMDINDLLEFLP